MKFIKQEDDNFKKIKEEKPSSLNPYEYENLTTDAGVPIYNQADLFNARTTIPTGDFKPTDVAPAFTLSAPKIKTKGEDVELSGDFKPLVNPPLLDLSNTKSDKSKITSKDIVDTSGIDLNDDSVTGSPAISFGKELRNYKPTEEKSILSKAADFISKLANSQRIEGDKSNIAPYYKKDKDISKDDSNIFETISEDSSKTEDLPNAEDVVTEPETKQEEVKPKIKKPTEASPVDKAMLDSIQNRKEARLGKIFSKLSDAIAGAGAGRSFQQDTSLYDDLLQTSNQPLQNILIGVKAKEQLREEDESKAKADSDSDISKFIRDSLEQQGIKNIPQTLSYNQLEKLYPTLSQALYVRYKADVDRIGKVSDFNNKVQARHDLLDKKRLDKLADKLEGEAKSSTSAFGKAIESNRLINNLEALISGHYLNDLTDAQVTEVARVLDRILSGGAATQYTTQHLTPKSARSFIQEKLSWLTNVPQGAQLGSFVQKYKEGLERERRENNKQISSFKTKVISDYNDIGKRPEGDPFKDRLLGILESHGLEGTFNEKGVFTLNDKVKDPNSTTLVFVDGSMMSVPNTELERVIKRIGREKIKDIK